MIPLPRGVRGWLATGHTDMRKGFDGLALLVQETFKRDPHSGHLFVFRGRRGGLIKGLWHGWPGHVPVCQAAGARAVHLAVSGGWDGDDHASAAWLLAGGDRLAHAAPHLATASSRLIAA